MNITFRALSQDSRHYTFFHLVLVHREALQSITCSAPLAVYMDQERANLSRDGKRNETITLLKRYRNDFPET